VSEWFKEPVLKFGKLRLCPSPPCHRTPYFVGLLSRSDLGLPHSTSFHRKHLGSKSGSKLRRPTALARGEFSDMGNCPHRPRLVAEVDDVAGLDFEVERYARGAGGRDACKAQHKA
jgi:hypothetical protein